MSIQQQHAPQVCLRGREGGRGMRWPSRHIHMQTCGKRKGNSEVSNELAEPPSCVCCDTSMPSVTGRSPGHDTCIVANTKGEAKAPDRFKTRRDIHTRSPSHVQNAMTSFIVRRPRPMNTVPIPLLSLPSHTRAKRHEWIGQCHSY